MQIKVIILLLSLMTNAIATTQDNDNHKLPYSINPIIQKTAPNIVNIEVQGEIAVDPKNPIQPPQLFMGFSSGIIMDANKGYIITNAHNVIKAKKIFVTLYTGVKIPATIIGTDTDTDIAVLQIEPQNIKNIVIGNSNELKIGDFVAAIGNTFKLNIANGSQQSVTFGVVSALNRSNVALADGFYDFIQSDVAINPGNSGGALIDMHGKLIGITTAILVPNPNAVGNIGVSFAIPINMAKSIMEQIIKYGSIKRGSMGVMAQDVNIELAKLLNSDATKGAVVTQITNNSPAQQAGLQIGDIIIKADENNIDNASALRNVIGLTRINSSTTLHIIRDGKTKTIKVTINEYNAEDNNNLLAGLQMKDVTEHSPVHGVVNGIQIYNLSPNSPAFVAGIIPGDIIVQANRQKINTVTELKQLVAKEKNNILLLVIRGNASIYLIIKR